MKKLLFFLLLPFLLSAQSINIIAWNVESGGINADTISLQIQTKLGRPDILLLSEVAEKDATTFYKAFADLHDGEAKMILGKDGGGDRLLCLYSIQNLKLLKTTPVDMVALGNPRLRASQLMVFRDKRNNYEFALVNNHLSRGSADDEYKREAQAYMLQNMVKSLEDKPCFLMGDFNFDYSLSDPEATRSKAFDILRLNGKDQVLIHWVKPRDLINTQCSWDEKRRMCRYNAILDFAFTNNAGLQANPRSEILSWPADFPDGKSKSDHRPISLILNSN